MRLFTYLTPYPPLLKGEEELVFKRGFSPHKNIVFVGTPCIRLSLTLQINQLLGSFRGALALLHNQFPLPLLRGRG